MVRYGWVLSQDEADGDEDSPEQLDGSVDDTSDNPYEALYPTPQPPPGPAGKSMDRYRTAYSAVFT